MKTDYFKVHPEAAEDLLLVCRRWLGTPWRKGCAVQGPQGGVDCVELVAAVFHEVGAIVELPPRPDYAVNHAEHSDESLLKAWLDTPAVRTRLRACDEEEAFLMGDLVFPRVGRCEHHMALWLGAVLCHVARPSGVCFPTAGQYPLHRCRYRLTT